MWQNQGKVLVYAAVGVAVFIGLLLYAVFDSWRVALGISGVLLAIDLTLLPKVLPEAFKADRDKDKNKGA